jgi:hypothetical protein
MKSHQLTCSHWPKRRSSQLVRKTMIRSAKYAASCGGSPCPPAASRRIRCIPSGVRTSLGSGATPNTVPSARPPVRGDLVSSALSRLSQTPFALPGNGMRRIESGTWW